MEKNGEIAGRSLDILLKGYAGILGRGSDPLTENAEYMQLVELHFLVKKYDCSHILWILMHYLIHTSYLLHSIRELTDIQLYQVSIPHGISCKH